MSGSAALSGPGASGRPRRRLPDPAALAPFAALALLVVLGVLLNPRFVALENIVNVVARASMIAVIGIGAVGHENGLRLRVFGEQGGLDWSQEHPNQLRLTRLGEAPRILHRGLGGLSGASGRATRIPVGHPEG